MRLYIPEPQTPISIVSTSDLRYVILMPTNATTWDTPVCATLSSYTCAACSRGMTGRHDPLPVGSR